MKKKNAVVSDYFCGPVIRFVPTTENSNPITIGGVILKDVDGNPVYGIQPGKYLLNKKAGEYRLENKKDH